MPTRAQPAEAAREKAIRILLVDDHPIVRQGLSQLINQERDLAVCAEAEDVAAALRSIVAHQPDLVIADIALEGRDGIELVKQIRANDARLPILILSMHDESLYAERALRAGANGYIMKQEATEKVLVAVRRILAGEVYVSERMANKLLREYVAGPALAERSPIDLLTDRELEVFRLIGRGQGTRQVAESLHISIKTVEAHQARIKEKLSLRNARELLQRAMQWLETERVW